MRTDMLQQLEGVVRRAGDIVREAHDIERATMEKHGAADLVTKYDVAVQGFLQRELLALRQALLDSGATVVVIEHDLDVIRNADYIIDMGPGGGDAGGRIVACGTPEQICNDPASITGRYLRR